MSTELDLDIAAMVGEMEAPACESDGHAHEPWHDDGAATHYGRITCPDCMFMLVKAYCKKFTANVTSGVPLRCPTCLGIFDSRDYITILGPVNQ